MSVTLAVLTTDGRRHCIEQTIESAEANLKAQWAERVIFTDSDPAYTAWLTVRFPDWWIRSTGDKAGYAPAMHAAFARLDAAPGPVMWIEDDATFNEPVDVEKMRRVLERHSHLAQLALRRQPWNDQEKAAGGIVEQHPDWYVDCHDEEMHADWLEQTGFWTNNASLIAPWVFDVPYPTGADAEGHFSFALRDARPDARFAYWGARTDPPQIHHIGDVQARGSF